MGWNWAENTFRHEVAVIYWKGLCDPMDATSLLRSIVMPRVIKTLGMRASIDHSQREYSLRSFLVVLRLCPPSGNSLMDQ